LASISIDEEANTEECMTFRAVLTAAACAALAFASQAQAQQSEQDRKLCASFEDVRSALDNFETLSPDATVEEAEIAADRVEASVKQARKAAEKARPKEAERLQNAVEGLEEAVDDAPDDATLGQVQANIQRNRTEVRQAFQELVRSANCPGMQAGQQQPSPQQQTR
jgi:hypothetical protein